jgi:flagellar biosynthesis chaperone FliJ
MGVIERRLERLERLEPADPRRPRSPEHVLDRIRREAAESIEESLRKGEEPLYRIKDNGDVETADGRSVDHYGDYIRALDERIGKLDREITELEAEEENLQERNLYENVKLQTGSSGRWSRRAASPTLR